MAAGKKKRWRWLLMFAIYFMSYLAMDVLLFDEALNRHNAGKALLMAAFFTIVFGVMDKFSPE